MIVELTPEQRGALLELINRELLELGPEIHHTWTRDYRENLKQERRVLLELRERLGVAAAEETPDNAAPLLGAM